MITESYPKMMTEVEKRSMPHNTDFIQDLVFREGELNMYRSGSAPPTVEGSLSAVGGLFSHGGAADLSGVLEEKMRSDPEYISYYYSNVNLNPRLPPPLLSKEDWRFAQRLQGSGGSIGDRRKVRRAGDDVIDSRKPQSGAKWGGYGLIGLSGLDLGSRTKSIAEILQEDIGHVASVSRNPSRPGNRNVFDNGVESNELHFGNVHHEKVSMDSLSSSVNNKCMSSASQIYASALGASLSRSTTPDRQLVARVPSPSMPPVGGGRASSMNKRNSIDASNSFNGLSPGMNNHSDLVAALSGMALSTSGVTDEERHPQPITQRKIDDSQKLFHRKSDQNHIQYPYLTRSESGQFRPYSNGGKSGSVWVDLNNSSLIADGHIEAHRPTVSLENSYLNGPSTLILNGGGGSPSNYHTLESPHSAFSNYDFTGYAVNPASPSMMGNQTANLPPLFENALNASAMGLSGLDSRVLGRGMNLGPNLMAASSAFQMPPIDPLYLHYLRTSEYVAAQAALSDPSIQREGMGNAYVDLIELQKGYMGSLLTPQKSQYGLIDGSVSQNYYGNSAFGLGMLYPSSPLAGTLLPKSPFGSGSPVRHGERNMYFPSEHFASSLRDGLAPSLLDEFKSNKAKVFELSEISGHVVEFSADQHGSRFIQQKLETATSDEKNMIFHEIMPQALSLITDVFGNYVIQKFFEHGTASQIRELADQLAGHVLTLSLQMYGCRVIQKAIEVVDLDQKIKMTVELDGNVMRCIHDQNGNHVVQKCIECIPQEAIQFIISVFYDQVVKLSTHPYGCRVIQRVLEHCSDPEIQLVVMDEILQSVSMLAQDQYGNYVVQHVLEHGKPHERSFIINKLIGKLVQMSQQKFASNVVEKCLAFGTPEERKILVNEMMGSTEEIEPLQVMMKDQFANYVVQKLLETCDNEQLELILNRIKVHLNGLKKYTYGKHIVARVEKLVAAGERRISILSSQMTLETNCCTAN